MASRNAALQKSEAANTSLRKRNRDLKKKIMEAQPTEIVATVTGAGAGGFLDGNTPLWLQKWGLRYPSAAVGILAISYGIFSQRSGQTEKLITCAGTGMLSGVAYDYSKTEFKM